MAAVAGCYAFAPDNEYFAHCGNDGKLKIWETASGRLKQEYVSNFHLSSPCCVLSWIYVSSQSTNSSPSPWKKRRKKVVSEETNHKGVVAMGSTNGRVTLYDTATSTVSVQLDGHSGAVSAVVWSESAGLFTAAEDHHIIHWNLQENGMKCKWKSGKDRTTSLAVPDDGKTILSAERVIKWWDLLTKQLIRTFTGHANQVTCLSTVRMNADSSYAISGACSDGYLSVWALDRESSERTSVASLALQDDPVNISVHVSEDSQVTVLAVTRSGQAHLYKYQPNGRSKPLKPNLNVAVASDLSNKETVQQIPILTAKLTDDEKLMLAYGSYLSPLFERVTPDFSDKVQCLVRSESKRSKDRKDDISKVKSVVEDDVEYLAPGIAGATQKRNRLNSGSQLLLKDRLENLSLSTESTSAGRTPSKGGNMAHLLMQGLNSKDRSILSTVLFTKNESVIRNTIVKLPVQAIGPLLKELTVLLQGKTYASKVAVKWLEALLSTHAGHFLSRADLTESFGPILSLIDAKLTLFTELSRLKGRVSLVTGQISQTTEEQDKDITEDCVLVYQDPDSSDEGGVVEDEDLESESDDNWDEMSNQEEENDHEIRSTKSDDDNNSICS